MTASQRRIYLIDGSSYIYRAYFAIRHLSNSRGEATNAIYGFTNMLLKVVREEQPDHLAVVFESVGELTEVRCDRRSVLWGFDFEQCFFGHTPGWLADRITLCGPDRTSQ